MSTAQTQPSGKQARPGPRTPDDRLATALRRLRWPVVIAWLLAVVALSPLSSTLSSATSDTASAYLPASAASTKVALLQEAAAQAAAHAGGRLETSQATVIFASDTELTASDAAAIRSARTAVAGLIGRVPGLSAPTAALSSADGKAAIFTVTISGQASSASTDGNAVTAIRTAIAGPARSAGTGLAAEVTGPAAVTADTSTGSQQAILMLTALIVVAVILLVVYGSPVLWLLPLLGGIAAIVVAQAAAHGLANGGFTVSTLSADVLIVLVFGAASDYALLLVHRYRSELRRHAAPEAAMATALRRTLPTLVASAATVACAMLCLLAADSASLHGLGPVGAVGIVAALVAQVTFLPALLLAGGRVAFWPRIPRAGAPDLEESRLWAGVGRAVARRPIATMVVTVLLLAAACAGLASLRFSDNPLDNVKGSPGSVTGARLLAEHYPAGDLAPLVLLVPPAKASAAASAARGTAGVAAVTQSGRVRGYASYSVILSAPPFGSGGTAAIVGLRQRLAALAPGSLVGGNPAIQYDIARAAERDEEIIIPLVLVVILLVISLLLRALVAPVVLVATTALSFGASFGLSSLLWRYGFGYPGVQSELPIYFFIFLVALGVDYNIFLSARVREESRTLGIRAGTLRGLGVTGGVITAAGIVLAGTFAALTQIPQVAIAEVGTAVALGVLLDTLVVRTVLVPASLLAIGERSWWPSRRRGRHRGARKAKTRVTGQRTSFPSLSR
jgi:RND superfamily putative drug exporter